MVLRPFWRAELRQLAAQLDIIDELMHALHVRLEEEEQRLRDSDALPSSTADVEPDDGLTKS